MKIAATMVWAVLAGISGAGLFLLKSEVQAQEQRLAALNKDIADTQQSIHVLKAEWSYLNDPLRLRTEAQNLLGLHPLKPSQIGSIDSIPIATPAPSDNTAPVNPPLASAHPSQPAPKPARIASSQSINPPSPAHVMRSHP